ncbi:MAG: hypothetical protein JW743_11330 [Deltaproteobacteria bacterium]|nr:hypothetical protein [Deltaproteobacteria bacterium]
MKIFRLPFLLDIESPYFYICLIRKAVPFRYVLFSSDGVVSSDFQNHYLAVNREWNRKF